MTNSETPGVVPIFDGPAGNLIDDLVAEEIAALHAAPLSERHTAVLRELQQTLGLAGGSGV